MKTSRSWRVAWKLLLLALPAGGAEILVPLAVDTNASSFQLTLAVQGEEDSDTQAVSGSLLLAVDCFAPLTAASLRDFHIRATSNFNFYLSYGIFGDLTGSTANLEIRHADPGTNRPYEAISSGMFNFREIPNALGGTAAYRASGVPCVVLQSGGRPCVDTIPLANQATTPIGEFSGALTLSNGMLHLVGNFHFGPVSVAPDTSISGVATITAVGVLQPCLHIELGPFLDDHRVSWSTAFGDFRLVRATALTLPVRWEEAVPVLGFHDGTVTNALFENPPDTMFFYRLESPARLGARSRP